MATIMLGAVGASLGGAMGGTVMGLTGAVAGRALGATVGRVIDQRLLGAGSETVEHGRIERFRVTGASEGAPLPLVFGRMRIGGQVIWASPFTEHASSARGGKGGAGPEVRQYSYTVSLAIALCEGVITDIGRIWADGVEIARSSVTLRLYRGDDAQLPDARIVAEEGAENAPAYRGTAYVVIEDLALDRFGNRVPQFSFEVMRPAQGVPEAEGGIGAVTQAVALIPGTGEYALATTPAVFSDRLGRNRVANVNSPAGVTDFRASLDQMGRELPKVGSVSLVVSWFGTDLRCGDCTISPKVEQVTAEAAQPWRVSGLARRNAEVVAMREGRPVYGGTPSDGSVIEALTALAQAGKRAVFYPFILMEQLQGNARPDPWGGGEQPALPWRGRITLSRAPGEAGSPFGTIAAKAEVARFFGSARVEDFTATGTTIVYTGPPEWSYRRFILHYAHLCALAGGVDAFCIGSEMVALTAIRDAGGFPAVAELCRLAADVRAILPDAKIGYAADWSEYFGTTDPEGNRWFHLDPLWAHPAIDFIGIDNYMPLSDWRDGSGHADAAAGTIHDLDYLTANVAGGEGYDWYYATPQDRGAQRRTPITDGAGEPWIWRYKDILNWWRNPHHDRVGGVRQAAASPWVPMSKPIWFTEIGCAAVDKGTNEPNKFLDPKSSESALPHFSTGARDDLIQMQYLRALARYWSDPAANPVSPHYGGPMVDMARAHVWAWDARPWPAFPQATDVWSDGENHARGHWITGRTAAQPLGAVVAEICARAGVGDVDVARLHGLVRGLSLTEQTARGALQALMLAYGVDAAERDGRLVFSRRGAEAVRVIDADAIIAQDGGDVQQERAGAGEIPPRLRIGHIDAEADYEARSVEVTHPGEEGDAVSETELPLALTAGEAMAVAERWLAETRVARDTARFALPPSAGIGAGEVVQVEAGGARGLYRIDRLAEGHGAEVEAVRVEPALYAAPPVEEPPAKPRPFVPPAPVAALFLDLPLLSGAEVPHAPHLAVTASPWPGDIAVLDAPMDSGYRLNGHVERAAVIGETLEPLGARRPGLWDRGRLRVRMSGALSSAERLSVLNGANAAAVGDGSPDGWEVIQFATATLTAPDTYELTHLLRGQAGTEREGHVWPAGSRFVLLDHRVGQIALDPARRGMERHYRIGPAGLAYDDPAFVHLTAAFRGVGLRPYRPVHLRMRREGGDMAFRWIRRSRLDGDDWESRDIPLGETREAYLIRVIGASGVMREAETTMPDWRYSAQMRAADGPALRLEVAQLSDRFGPGPFASLTF